MSAQNGSKTMTLLKDLILIPESVHKSDFVVSLKDGIGNPKAVVDNYVVTDQLVGCFRNALELILSSVEDSASKGAYLHGSFGAGKSHFMAILHLLLQGDVHVRAKPELAPVVDEFDERLQGRKFLLVPYHMVGARSMEDGVLGGYVDYVRALHPDASTPAVYVDDEILNDARSLRNDMGDDAFFGRLGGAGSDDGFGDLAGGWNAERFEAAAQAPPDSTERRRLVADYIDTFATAIRHAARASGQGFVPFADGLDAISQHASGLGYDGVVLFLDELILWFASRMPNPDFVQAEGQKIANLVEAASQDRPAPLASLIARQRDLREFLGEGVPGADQLNFGDSLEWWESRFDTIQLSDTNLRAIVQKRLLQPKNPEARAQLDSAFEEVADQAGSALDTLLTSDADKEAFRRVYPFSPAMIDTLVAVSAYLQRERTALRLLAQLLSQKAPSLEVGDLVPIGDLYDVIRDGEEPFSDQLKRHFQSARSLYDHKLRPLLLQEHGLDSGEALEELPHRHPARMGDRILKTLLLASLVPDVGPLKGLTVRRLADLNHGSIRSPIRGEEAATVLAFLKKWAPEVPELQFSGDDQDPVVSLQLSGVDIDSIVKEYRHVDNSGARRSKVRELVYQALNIDSEPSIFALEHSWEWRGRKRIADVRFGNVRDPADIPDSEFRAQGRPRVILDFPFDDPGHGPADDLARMQELGETLESTPTVAWLPLFFTEEALQRLGRLVILDHLLTGDRLEGATAHLAPQDRGQARTLLKNQQSSLRGQMTDILRQAYGVISPKEQWVQPGLSGAQQFPTLDPFLKVQPPTAPSMTDAFGQILDQVMSHLYPAHPKFEARVTTGDLKKCLEHVARAVGEKHGRAEIPQSDRAAVRKVLGPLEIATTGDAHITMKRHWKDHFQRRIQEVPGTPVTVERLRQWIDDPEPMGLEDELASLVIAAWCMQDNRILMNAGLQIEPQIGKLAPNVEARTQDLPTKSEWEAAAPKLNAIFGVQASPVLNASNLASALGKARETARQRVDSADALHKALIERVAAFGGDTEGDRVQTARAVVELLDFLTANADDVAAVRHLAVFDTPTSPQALGRSMKSASEVRSVVVGTNWELFDLIDNLKGGWRSAADKILHSVREGLEQDELAVPLGERLRAVTREATALLGRATAEQEPGPGPTGGDKAELPVTGELSGEEAKLALRQLAARSEEIDELLVRWRLRAE